MTRHSRSAAILFAFGTVLLSACGNSPTVDTLGHTTLIGWYVVDAQTSAPARLEMLLDAKPFYSESTSGLQRRAETMQDYVPGRHVLEIVVVDADPEGVTLTATAHHKPTQASEYRNVSIEPKTLRSGERVSFTFED